MKNQAMNFLSLIFALSHIATTLAATLEIPTIVMQLRSEVDSDNSELLTDMLDKTTKYMDDYFSAFYENTEPKDYFSHVAFTVNSFGIQGVTGSFITTLEFDGMLFFNSDPAPSEAFATALLTNAFQGVNLDLFLQKIFESNDSFLKHLTHLIVEINETPITEHSVAVDGGAPSSEKDNDNGVIGDLPQLAIFVAAGAIVMLLIVLCCCLCRYMFCKRKQVDDDVAPVKLNSISIPDPRSPAQRQSRRSKSRPTKTNIAELYGRTRERTPSPVRSIASQDSSKFTYNPSGMSMMSKASFSVGSFSNFNNDAPSIDIDAWTRQNTISPVNPAPFGHDISAIEQKERDLSLIEEGNEESFEGRRGGQYLSRKTLSALEVRNARNRGLPGRASTIKELPTRIYTSSTEESSNYTESSSDVINDLKNLSLQIDEHRRGSRSSRYNR